MPCTAYVFERSLLIDGLSAGAKVCLLTAVVAVVACKGRALVQPAPAVVPSTTQHQPPTRPVADRSCDPLASVGSPRDTIEVVSTVPVLPSDIRTAPTAGHRFVFERAYQTLMRVDCTGQAYSALAVTWAVDTLTRTTVILRADARFWNGDRVTSKDVVAAWRASGDSLAIVLADSTQFPDDSTLFIHLRAFDVRVLASPRLAVVRSIAGSVWPEGTGTHRLIQSDGLTLQPVQRDSGPVFHVRAVSLSDARNLIDDGIDILLTGDSATAAYASRRFGSSSVPLEWDRAWMLVVPGSPSEPLETLRDYGRMNDVRDDLARDAVRANARRAEMPMWVFEPQMCFGRATGPNTRPRIAYRGDDPVARTIAERLVALGSSRAADTSALARLDAALAPPGTRLTAAPLSGAAFDAALRGGSETAVVFSVTYHSARICAGARIIPLVDTRWQAVLRPTSKHAP